MAKQYMGFINLEKCDTENCMCSVFVVTDSKKDDKGDMWLECHCLCCGADFWENLDAEKGIPF